MFVVSLDQFLHGIRGSSRNFQKEKCSTYTALGKLMLFISNNGDVDNFKLPSQLAIRPYTIAIQEVPENEISGAWGQWDPETLTIKICESAPPIMKYSAFIHETIEAINGLYDLGIPHAKRTVIEIALQNVELIEGDI